MHDLSWVLFIFPSWFFFYSLLSSSCWWFILLSNHSLSLEFSHLSPSLFYLPAPFWRVFLSVTKNGFRRNFYVSTKILAFFDIFFFRVKFRANDCKTRLSSLSYVYVLSPIFLIIYFDFRKNFLIVLLYLILASRNCPASIIFESCLSSALFVFSTKRPSFCLDFPDELVTQVRRTRQRPHLSLPRMTTLPTGTQEHKISKRMKQIPTWRLKSYP